MEDSLATYNSAPLEAIAFNMGDMAGKIKIGEEIDLAYTIDENNWNGNSKIQLKVRDINLVL